MRTPGNTGTGSVKPRSSKPPAAPKFEGLEARELLSALPDPGVALSLAEIKGVFSQVIARATQLGVNATISMVDREGNIMGVVRMRNPALQFALGQSRIVGGGTGGLEGIALPSSIFSSSKAGTAAFLSTRGNAFSTRTAGFIIQQNFPGGARNQPSGPLFGVQLSSLPTSDLMRLPIGLAADPGGLPLYRAGQVVAGIGVEFDNQYTAPNSRVGGDDAPTVEEQAAAAALTGFEPPSSIRADNILVAGIRFTFMRGEIPSRESLGALPDFDAMVASGQLVVLSAPAESPATKFATVTLAGFTGDTVFGFQQGNVEGFAVRGGDAFIVQPTASLVRRLSRIDIATGTATFIANISGPGAGQITVGHRVSALALDDAATADTADDRVLAFDADAGAIAAFSASTGAAQGITALANPDSVLRDAVAQRTGGSTFVFGISESTGQVFRVDAGTGTALALTPNDGNTYDSFALGEGGLFGVRAGPQGVLTGSRTLVLINTDGSGTAVIADISDNGTNEGSVSQPVPVLAYDNAGTASTADDTLVAQNATRGRQFRMTIATGAIATPQVEIASPRFVLTSGRLGSAGTIVGVSEQTGQFQRLAVADVANPASLTSLTAIDTTSLTRGGVDASGAMVLTPAEVQTILEQAHRRNDLLRAAIRRDRPQKSQVSVSVCDVQGNLLGIFRRSDAPIFGFDVSLQKARSVTFMSRTDAGAMMDTADAGLYAKYAQAARATGLTLTGNVGLANRSIAFIARPTLPDGIPDTGPGPLSTLAPDIFSPFSTGFQTDIILPNIFKYAFEFLSVSEGDALRHFQRGLIGGGGVTTPALPLQNGLQIFPGGVPLYKNGQLVGGVGTSGDGIEQDDSTSFSGSAGFQQFGSGVKRADKVKITQKLRLPYIKLPRKPTGGY